MKKLGYVLISLAILLSDVMCAVVAWSYRDMLCGIAHSCYSAPASVAFLHLIPFTLAITICVVLGWYFIKKDKKQHS